MTAWNRFFSYISGRDEVEPASSSDPPPPKRRKKDGKVTPKWQRSSEVYSCDDSNDVQDLLQSHPELSNLSPYELFTLFFDDDILNIIVDNTVLYARQKNDHGFTVTVEEMRQFIGILIVSSFNTRPQERHYWEKDEIVRCSAVAKTMSRERFKKIKSYFHLVDNSLISESNRSEKMFKLKPLLDHLRTKFCKFGQFHKSLCVDEQMIPYFGNHSCKQFLRGKPVRFGYKVWMLCSGDGYCYNFRVYCGKEDSSSASDDTMCKTSQVVLDLISVLEEPERHRLFFDNLFNSYDLLTELKKRGVEASGTARENRFSLKTAPITDSQALKKQPRGTFCEVSDGFVSFVKWRDNKVVCFASNYVGAEPAGECSRRIKGESTKSAIPRPKVAEQYNKQMGGVDLLDKMIGNYRIQLTSKKWYWRIINNFIEVALFNAWRIAQNIGNKVSFVQFMRATAAVLIHQAPQRNSIGQGPAASIPPEIRSTGQHWPVTKLKQRRCRQCKKNTTCGCETCDIPLHVECFKSFHQP